MILFAILIHFRTEKKHQPVKTNAPIYLLNRHFLYEMGI